MTADLFFDNVEFFAAPSGQRLRVQSGQTLRIELKDAPEGVYFATTADPILTLNDSGTVATVSTNTVGTSEVQVQKDRGVLMYIGIEVYSATEAVSLGIAAGTPEPK